MEIKIKAGGRERGEEEKKGRRRKGGGGRGRGEEEKKGRRRKGGGGRGRGEEEGEEEEEANRRKGRVKEERGRARGENVLLVICVYDTAGRVSLRGGSTTTYALIRKTSIIL